MDFTQRKVNIKVKLGEILETEGITRYQLARIMAEARGVGGVDNSVYNQSSPSLSKLEEILGALEVITGKKFGLRDILEVTYLGALD